MLLAVVIVALVVGSQAQTLNYEGYKVYEVVPHNFEQQQVLELLHSDSRVDFWSESRLLNNTAVVMVQPSMINDFISLMILNNMEHREIIDDVSKTINYDAYLPQPRNGRISHQQYNRYSTITAYLKNLASSYSHVTLLNIGRSTEGRDILGVKISSGPNRPAILVDAGIHAREWIAPAFALYLIEQLAENSVNADLYSSVDWLIIPCLNPDGYEYTHTNNRMWRKTRSLGTRCYGADPNRNFGYHWNEVGASSYECDDIYAGKKAFSELETQAIRDFATANKNTIKMYLTFHSYGNYILYPWGYTSALPKDDQELRSIAQDVNSEIRAAGGPRYTIGTSTNVLYAAAGGSDDYMKGVLGIELSYTLELPGGGWNGFDPPASSIAKIVKETFAGVKVYGRYVARKWNL